MKRSTRADGKKGDAKPKLMGRYIVTDPHIYHADFPRITRIGKNPRPSLSTNGETNKRMTYDRWRYSFIRWTFVDRVTCHFEHPK